MRITNQNIQVFNSLKPLVKKIPIAGSHLFYLASAIYKSQEIKKLLKNIGSFVTVIFILQWHIIKLREVI